MKLYLFNPECDIVRGLDSRAYTPTAQVRAMRRRLCLAPAAYAEMSDSHGNSKGAILLPDDISDDELCGLPYFDMAVDKKLRFVRPSEASGFVKDVLQSDGKEILPMPWGWDKAAAWLYTKIGVPKDKIPSGEWLDRLRHESSRERTVDFFGIYGGNFPGIEPPRYITDVKEALSYRRAIEDCWFKSPWSSSGRGNIRCTGMSERKIEEWLGGVIHAQGGVLAERNYQRVLDFASLWEMHAGKASFVGYSVFEADAFGKYKQNLIASQANLRAEIESRCAWSDDILDMQREFLEMPCRADIEGPVGFDMLADADGRVNPCVEINRRYTMGFVALYGHKMQKQ